MIVLEPCGNTSAKQKNFIVLEISRLMYWAYGTTSWTISHDFYHRYVNTVKLESYSTLVWYGVVPKERWSGTYCTALLKNKVHQICMHVKCMVYLRCKCHTALFFFLGTSLL